MRMVATVFGTAFGPVSRARAALVAILALATLATGCAAGGTPLPSVKIESPVTGSTVPAGRTVAISVTLQNARLQGQAGPAQSREGHLHLFVDGQLAAMPNELMPTVTLPPGPHTLQVEFVAPNHAQFAPRILDQVQVEAK